MEINISVRLSVCLDSDKIFVASSGAFFDKNWWDVNGVNGEIGFQFFNSFFNYLGSENYFVHEVSLGGIRWRVKPFVI